MFLTQQSGSEPVWTLKVRWRALLTPVCLLLGHDVEYVQNMWMAFPSYERCRRCCKKLWEEDCSHWMPDSEGEALPPQSG